MADNQASENLKINLTELQSLGNSWGSAPLQKAYQELSVSTDDANSGNIQGNRIFYANDYAVSVSSVHINGPLTMPRYNVAMAMYLICACTPSAP